MSIFYFTTPDDREYELSCTTEVSVKESAVVTKSPVESGKSIIDNYYLDNRIVTFNGLITNVTVLGQLQNRVRDVDSWIDDIRAIRQKKDFLTVHYDSTKSVPNCIITQFDISKTKVEGNSGWKCTLVFQEVDISERARLTEIPEPKPDLKNETDPLSKTSSSNKEEVPQALATTVGSDAITGSYNFITGQTNASSN